MDISIVIPLYNEEENISALYTRLSRVLEQLGRSYEIIVVDDGSTDCSFAILKELQAQDERLIVVRLRRNFGQTAAFTAGFDLAAGEIIVTLDADLQNDPEDIARLVEMIEQGYDVVSGWRVTRQDALLSRRLPSMIANRLISVMTDVHLHDYGCSLKAYRREVIKSINLYGELHRFIPAVASLVGVSIAEVPVNHYPRQHGRSKYGISRTFRVLLDLITVRFLLSYSTRPIHIFGGMGFISFAVGVVLGLYLTFLKLFMSQSIGDRPLLLLAVLLILVGVQLVSMGLLGELVVRTYHEAQGKPIYAVREIVSAREWEQSLT